MGWGPCCVPAAWLQRAAPRGAKPTVCTRRRCPHAPAPVRSVGHHRRGWPPPQRCRRWPAMMSAPGVVMGAGDQVHHMERGAVQWSPPSRRRRRAMLQLPTPSVCSARLLRGRAPHGLPCCPVPPPRPVLPPYLHVVCARLRQVDAVLGLNGSHLLSAREHSGTVLREWPHGMPAGRLLADNSTRARAHVRIHLTARQCRCRPC